MTTTTIKGQFTQGDAQKMKKPNKQKIVFFGNDLPRISPDLKFEGHTPNRQGAI